MKRAVRRSIDFLRENLWVPVGEEVLLASENHLEVFASDGELAAFAVSFC